MTTTETWLDIIPALPLVRSVPVGAYADLDLLRGVVVDVSNADTCQVVWSDDPKAYDTEASILRVDLDDDQGFGYGLRLLWQSGVNGNSVLIGKHMGGLASGYWRAETTDTDRLALARALAEVFA